MCVCVCVRFFRESQVTIVTNGHVCSLSFLSSVRVLCQPPVGDTRYFTFTLKNKRKGKKNKQQVPRVKIEGGRIVTRSQPPLVS